MMTSPSSYFASLGTHNVGAGGQQQQLLSRGRVGGGPLAQYPAGSGSFHPPASGGGGPVVGAPGPGGGYFYPQHAAGGGGGGGGYPQQPQQQRQTQVLRGSLCWRFLF